MQEVANPQISYLSSLPEQPLMLECDGRLLSQAITNILKNAGEAISSRAETEDEYKGKITIDLRRFEDRIELVFEDNGCGLPKEHRHRLTEPYMTTRDKGTGLGLAIVKKIMEEHKGELSIEDAAPISEISGDGQSSSGARIRMVFNLENDESGVLPPDDSEAFEGAAPAAAITGV